MAIIYGTYTIQIIDIYGYNAKHIDYIINHGSDVRLAYNLKKIYAKNFNFIKQLNIIKYKLNNKNNVSK